MALAVMGVCEDWGRCVVVGSVLSAEHFHGSRPFLEGPGAIRVSQLTFTLRESRDIKLASVRVSEAAVSVNRIPTVRHLHPDQITIGWQRSHIRTN